jgi:hypothetical protein
MLLSVTWKNCRLDAGMLISDSGVPRDKQKYALVCKIANTHEETTVYD